MFHPSYHLTAADNRPLEGTCSAGPRGKTAPKMRVSLLPGTYCGRDPLCVVFILFSSSVCVGMDLFVQADTVSEWGCFLCWGVKFQSRESSDNTRWAL